MMLNRKAFISVPSCLDVEGPENAGHCWKCEETHHLSSSCLEKKASGVITPANPNPHLVEKQKRKCLVVGKTIGKPRTMKP